MTAPADTLDDILSSVTAGAETASPDARTSAAIDRLFRVMFDRGASDLHLCVGMPPLVRKDGSIQPLEPEAAALDPDSLVALLDPIMPPKNRDEFARRHDTDFAYEIPGLARFRANVFMDRKGRGAVFRVIPSKILTAADLGLDRKSTRLNSSHLVISYAVFCLKQ